MNTEPLPKRILIADDEPLYLRTTAALLRKAGYECECVSNSQDAIQSLHRSSFDLILSDLNMPGNFKLELLREGRSQWPHIPLIVVTGVPSLPTAIEGVRLGIVDYLLKPVKFEDLLTSIDRVLSQAKRQRERSELPADRRELAEKFPEVVCNSEPMLDVLEIIDRVAQTDTNILITGESGTGKEVIAQAIHRNSHRRDHPFQIIDCTAVPEALFESVLFGHAKGAFTGAFKDQDGLLLRSDQGTAFLDEVGELPLTSQAKLLRAVQEQSFTPIGKATPVHVDTRFICATNRDMEADVTAGRFRRDLFYRLGVIHIELPALRDRGEDVVLLAEHFLKRLQPSQARVLRFSDEVLQRFREYRWPGNIRELRNAVERAIALTVSDQVELAALPKQLREPSQLQPGTVAVLSEISREEALDSAEVSYLTMLLEKHDGNISQAAQQAGLSRQGMHKLLKKHGISAAEFRE
jgi:two-component system response regulator HydG